MCLDKFKSVLKIIDHEFRYLILNLTSFAYSFHLTCDLFYVLYIYTLIKTKIGS